MASNTNLTELYCSSHPVAPHTASLLADMLAASPSLKSLCVGSSSLGDVGVAALARGVAASSLTRLDLCNKGLGPRGAAALSTALAAAPSLTHLLLNGNPKLADDGLRALCGGSGSGGGAASDSTDGSPVAAVWAGLRVLEVQGCGVTCAGVRALAASPSCCRLEVLRLDSNPLGAEGGKAVGELLRATTQLRELSLRGTELGDQGGEALVAALEPRSSAGSGSAVTAGGAVASGPAAPSRSPLVHLDLAVCGLGPRALAAFRDAFSSCVRLEVLCLAGNTEVSDGDVAQLGMALGTVAEEVAGGDAAAEARLPRLEHLDVSGTSAGPQAVAALSRAVGLRHLSMVGCPLGAPGAAALASSLAATASLNTAAAGEGGGAVDAEGPAWCELRELCISGTGLGLGELRTMFGALAAGGAPRLQSLEVGANPGTQERGFQELLDGLRTARPNLALYWRSGDDPAPPSDPR